MSLKTDYKDAVFTGNRLYEIVSSGGGKSTITDVTVYETAGDKFGAKDINDTNKAINRANGKKTVTLTATGWSSSAPYTQSVAVSGMTAEDLPIPSLDVSGATSEANKRQLRKQYSWIDYYDTSDGSIQFTARFTKPTMNLTIDLKGV